MLPHMRRVALLLPLLLLSSCASRAAQLRGQVRGWTGGEGRVELLDDDLHTIVSTPLDASGRFNLKLPTEQQLGANLQASLVPDGLTGCQNTVQATPGARYFTLGDLTAFPSQGGKVAYTLGNRTWNTDHTKLDKRVLIFATQNAQARGDLNCGPNTVGYRLSLHAGWNYAVSRQSLQPGGSNTIIESVAGKDGFEGWSVQTGG